MSCTRSQFVTQLQSWVGLKESNGSHKKIIDIYNTIKPLPVGYKVKYTDAWCAATVSAAAQELNAIDIIPAECSCPRMVEKAKKMGIWVEADNHIPQSGDIVLYDWDDSGKGDNTGRPDHVGVVEKISGNTMTIIEGNYSNAVKRRDLQVNGKYIRGYIVPEFDTEAKTADYSLNMRNLARNCTGSDVCALQILLKGCGYDCGQVDGDFGRRTVEAVTGYQADQRLTADGIAGTETMSRLLGIR